MKKVLALIVLGFVLMACENQDVQNGQNVQGGLQKITNPTESQIHQLRDAGADIIVRQPDYIVIRTTDMTEPLAFSAESIAEKDLVQRLVHIYAPDTTAKQTAINSGIDFWHVDGDTIVARAYDLYIDRLRDAGLDVRIVSQDASEWVEEKQ
jgi:hypothetical protein